MRSRLRPYGRTAVRPYRDRRGLRAVLLGHTTRRSPSREITRSLWMSRKGNTGMALGHIGAVHPRANARRKRALYGKCRKGACITITNGEQYERTLQKSAIFQLLRVFGTHPKE